MAKRKSKRWTATDLAGKKKSKGSTGPPMCKLCGSAHWGRDPHQWKKPKAKRQRKPKLVDGINYDSCKVVTSD